MYYLSDCPRTVNLWPYGSSGKDGDNDDEGLSFQQMLDLARRFRKSISTRSGTSGPSEPDSSHGEQTSNISNDAASAAAAIAAATTSTIADVTSQPPATEIVRTGPLALRQSPDSFLFVTWDRRSFYIWCTRVSIAVAWRLLINQCFISSLLLY
jgi:hypothetical protein